MPVFIALFYMLQDDLRLDICGRTSTRRGDRGSASRAARLARPSFLFIPDLTDNATGAVLVALIVLYVGSQLVSSILMSVSADKTQRTIMLALPFVFVPFIISFPAGLLVYWITTNLWTIGQQSDRAQDGRSAGSEPPPRRPARHRPAPERPAGTAGHERAGRRPPARPPRSPRRTAAPPPPPRRKKKRSGRRR